MSIDKHFNHDFSSGLPNGVGDRYYGQDRARDFWHLLSSSGKVLKDVLGVSKVIVSGGNVTHGTGLLVNLDSFNGYAPYAVTIPDSWASLPPTKKSADVELVNIVAPSVSNFNLATQPVPATCNGIAVNHIKIAYAETDLNSRVKVHGSGSYYSERVPSYVLSINTVAPTSYEVCLGELTCTNDGVTMVITRVNRDYSVYDLKEKIFLADGTWKRPPNCSYVKVLVCGSGGAGGQGGNGGSTNSGGGGGGGGGGYMREAIVPVSGDCAVVVAPQTISGNGASSSFAGDITITATGGIGGGGGTLGASNDGGTGGTGGGGASSSGGGGGGGGYGLNNNGIGGLRGIITRAVPDRNLFDLGAGSGGAGGDGGYQNQDGVNGVGLNPAGGGGGGGAGALGDGGDGSAMDVAGVDGAGFGAGGGGGGGRLNGGSPNPAGGKGSQGIVIVTPLYT